MTGAARGIDRRGLAVLGAGHACSDLCQGAVPALLPFLMHDRGYGYGAAASLVLVMTLTSSLLQPVFGHFADRFSLPALMPIGLLAGGLGIAAAGLAPSYALTALAVGMAGLGVGAFHPEAARYARHVSGARPAGGMSLFSVGGNAGFALGPLLVTPLVLGLGLGGTAWLLVLPLAASILLVAELGRLGRLRGAAEAAHRAAPGAAVDRWGPFRRVAAVAAVRSGVYFGLQAFLAAYLIAQRGASEAGGNAALTVLVVAGAVGTLVGGRVADRIGARAVVLGSLGVLPPLLLAFLASGRGVGIVLVALVGFFCVGSFSVTVVLGQGYLPGHLGTASGVLLGASIGAGGVAAAALGVLADHAGLVAVMVVIAALPIAGVLLALGLPTGERPPGPAPRPHAPEEPKPPTPRAVVSSASTSRTSTSGTGNTTSWAMRSPPASRTAVARSVLSSSTRSSPR